MYDAEVQMLIDAALYDMERAGVNPALLDAEDLENALVKKGVTAYCKANFGYDNAEAPRFDDAYNRVVIDLLNSSENIAAIAAEEEEHAASEQDGSFGLGASPNAAASEG